MQSQNVLRYSWWYLVIKSMVHEPYGPGRLHHVTKTYVHVDGSPPCMQMAACKTITNAISAYHVKPNSCTPSQQPDGKKISTKVNHARVPKQDNKLHSV